MRLQNKYLGSGPCPNCREQGRDRKGNNQAKYSDGSTYCFSCQMYTKGTERRKVFELGEEPAEVIFKERPQVLGPNRIWLMQYISQEEIDEFFFWSPWLERHVFSYHPGEPDWFYEARSIRRGATKVDSRGTKPTMMIGKTKESKTLVVVEDLLSAIKVGRQYGAMPLFGSHMTPDQMKYVQRSKQVDEVIFWLDSDKYDKGQELARKMSFLLPSSAIFTSFDPKLYNDWEIKNHIDAVKLEYANESS